MKKSHLIALGVTASVVLWMGAGLIFGDGKVTPSTKTDENDAPSNIMVVEIRHQSASLVVSNVIAQGHVMPDREVDLRVETAGAVHKILIKEGITIKAGDVLAQIDMDDRKTKLNEAKAKIIEAQGKYKSAKKLEKKGYTAESRVDETLSILRSAQAEEKHISLDIDHTNIVAPFDGIIDQQHIEQGDYVSLGDKVFTIVDNDPLVVSVYIPQHEIINVKVGGSADISLATGQSKTGKVRFIAPRAEKATRTFRMEIAIPNPDGLPSGISATVRIPKEGVMAHFVSTALLTLNIDGMVGVKTIDDKGIVSFYPVKILSADPSGVYVTGLPNKATIIINGQGFVVAGDKVSFTMSDASESSSKNKEKVDEDSIIQGMETKHESD